jgi:4-amino-4-deoxy-L-arabinose transferase-like glycosyltransferase
LLPLRGARTIAGVRAIGAGGRDRLTGAGILLLAASLRVLYVSYAWTIPAVRYPMVDSRAYHERALEIVSGQWLAGRIPYQDPLYPYFLAGLYALFGSGSVGVVIAQALLDAGTAVLVYAIARRVFDYRSAVLAGLLAASYPLFPYFDVQLLKVPLTVFLITLALLLAIEAQHGGRRRSWFAAGASLGLASLTRGNYLLFAPFLLAWVALAHRHAPRAGAVAGGLVALGLAACILPVTLHNYVVGDDLVLITSQAGQNFYIGNRRENATGRYVAPPFVTPNPLYEESDFRAEAERRRGGPLKPGQVSRYWFREAQREIAADPGHFLRHTAFKAALFFNHYEVPDNRSYYFFREHVTPVLKLPLPTYGALLPLALVGMGLGRRRRGAAPLILFFFSYAASVILFYNFSRYRMPVVPVVIVFAAAGLVGIADGLRRRHRVRTALALGFLVVAYVFVHRDLTSDDFATHHFNLALHHHESAARHRARAEALSASGDSGDARVEAERADRFQAAADEQLHLALGMQRPSAALRQRLPNALVTWIGEALRDGNDERALALSRDLTDAYPRFARGHVLLGKASARLGRDADAASALRRALALAPANPEARRLLEEAPVSEREASGPR